ncbi:hypothetical protein CRE_18720 [Caenorhabditis remanei]|uniref:Uncharacterized protein n=2 Tax=Caenorhabditis remanei TaxID=31234 RepID=E3LLL3_CAERE|nr:hypothetical protein CRE_18720 [Caenorhabditis remanei]
MQVKQKARTRGFVASSTLWLLSRKIQKNMTLCSPTYPISYLDTSDFYSRSLHILGGLSIPIHIFGAYCIIFKTPKSMNSVKFTMLNFHLWVALVDIVFSLIVCPFLLFPLFAAGGFGILDRYGVSRTFQTFLQLGSIEVMFISIILIFENRYFVIADVHKYWKAARKPWIALNYLCAFSVGIPIYLAIPKDQEKSKLVVFEKLPCIIPIVTPDSLFVIADDIFFYMVRGLIFNSAIIDQTLFFSWLTKRSLTKYGTRLSQKTLKLQKQFLLAMNIQLSIPFLSLVIPLAYVFFEYYLKFYYQKYNNIAFILFASHGLLSTIVMLMVHTPYREFISENIRNFGYLMGLKVCRRERLTSVMPSIVSTRSRNDVLIE